jgi:hypothetical protein
LVKNMMELEMNLKRVEIERRAMERSPDARRWFEKEVEEANPEPNEHGRHGLAERLFEEMVRARAALGAFLIR